ncbi:tRNA3(Ser)-specific nuclease WapA precursor [Novipirellula aureliae]|uniref:tRNA3(Ser)-specific nuclease WapA n=1 Tax=Novipirellula aureliae TaxID=2527966 RepID=A0A5C6D9G5_9BACT|nr:RHS repeat-associated core domain-containing protein [Novipirellula aureliae]TWU32434.1 tRNA3(Ser)-specific nuclease WapA precursor [Novipirellula aureliae]
MRQRLCQLTIGYHRNQQYSVTALTDGGGLVKERYAYDAYGTPTISDASGTTLTTTSENNRSTYTGREWDEDLRLYHYRARMYDPVAGRFCSRDPIGILGGWNKYANKFGLSEVDPTGWVSLSLHATPKNLTCSGCGNFDYLMDFSLSNPVDAEPTGRWAPAGFIVQTICQTRYQKDCVAGCPACVASDEPGKMCTWCTTELVGFVMQGNRKVWLRGRDSSDGDVQGDSHQVINPVRGSEQGADAECHSRGWVAEAIDARVVPHSPSLEAMWFRNQTIKRDMGCGYTIEKKEGPAPDPDGDLASGIPGWNTPISQVNYAMFGWWNCCPKPKGKKSCGFGVLTTRRAF